MTLGEVSKLLKDLEEVNRLLCAESDLLIPMENVSAKLGQIPSSKLEIELQQERCASLRLKLAVLETIEIQTYNKFNSEIPF